MLKLLSGLMFRTLWKIKNKILAYRLDSAKMLRLPIAKMTQMALGWMNITKEGGACMKTVILMILINYKVVIFIIFNFLVWGGEFYKLKYSQRI